jgi:hypothetical protein
MPNKLDPVKEIRQAIKECKKADALAEASHMRLMRVYWFAKNTDPSSIVVDRTDKATSVLTDSRTNFGEAVYQLEKLLE